MFKESFNWFLVVFWCVQAIINTTNIVVINIFKVFIFVAWNKTVILEIDVVKHD